MAFLRSTKFTTEFDGEQVAITLSPLLRGDMLRWLPELQKLSGSERTAQLAAFSELLDRDADALKKYVTKVEGLTDAAGAPVNVDDMFQYAHFSLLVMQVFMQLLAGNVLGKEMPAPSNLSQPHGAKDSPGDPGTS